MTLAKSSGSEEDLTNGIYEGFFEKLSWVQQDYPVGSIHEVEHNGEKVKARVVRVYQPPLQTQFVSVPTVEFETIDGEENEAKATK